MKHSSILPRSRGMKHSSIKFERCPTCSKPYRRHEEVNQNVHDSYKPAKSIVEHRTYFHCGGVMLFTQGSGDKYKAPSEDEAKWEEVCPKLTEVKLPE